MTFEQVCSSSRDVRESPYGSRGDSLMEGNGVVRMNVVVYLKSRSNCTARSVSDLHTKDVRFCAPNETWWRRCDDEEKHGLHGARRNERRRTADGVHATARVAYRVAYLPHVTRQKTDDKLCFATQQLNPGRVICIYTGYRGNDLW